MTGSEWVKCSEFRLSNTNFQSYASAFRLSYLLFRMDSHADSTSILYPTLWSLNPCTSTTQICDYSAQIGLFSQTLSLVCEVHMPSNFVAELSAECQERTLFPRKKKWLENCVSTSAPKIK